MKNAVIVALVVALAVSIAAGVIARATRTVNVEVRVWQDVDQPDSALALRRGPTAAPGRISARYPCRSTAGSAAPGATAMATSCIALSVPPPPSCAEPSLAPDCAVLLAARDTLAGEGALNWSADVPLTEWDGVTVSGTPRRVTGLDLRNRGLTGTIPPELGSLPPTLSYGSLLAGNAFTGCVPERLRLAENDLEALTSRAPSSWCCPCAAMPSLASNTEQPEPIPMIEWSLIDIPAEGPRLLISGIEHWDGPKIVAHQAHTVCPTWPVYRDCFH